MGGNWREESREKSHCWFWREDLKRQSNFVSCSPPYVMSWRITITWHPLRETGGSALISVTVFRRQLRAPNE